MNAAAIDLGTNSIKILIVRRDLEGHMQVLFRHRAVVRLGEGTFSKKGKSKIPKYVQTRTLKVLQTYAKFLEAYKVDLVRATGTSALRDSLNGAEFVKEVRAKTGIALETLPGEEEARLIVRGVSSEFPLGNKPCLFIDIGGGSAEVTLVAKKRIVKFASFPLGAVRMTELFLPGSKASSQDLKALRAHVRKVLKQYWPNPTSTSLAYGSAGTIRALARTISKTELTDDERAIELKQLERAASQITKLSKKRISALPGIDSKRAEILIAGTVVLSEIFSYFSVKNLKVSNRGLREGLLIDLFAHPTKPNAKGTDSQESEQIAYLSNLARRYHSNRSHCVQVANLCKLLFRELAPLHHIPPKFLAILNAAALVHDVGRYIGETGAHKHSYYIIRNSEIPFFSEREKILMAAVARYHKKSSPRPGQDTYEIFSSEEKKILEGLSAIIRIADALDAFRDQSVKWVKCQWGPGKVRINVEVKPGALLDEVTIRERCQLFEKLFNVVVTVVSTADQNVLKSQIGDVAARSRIT